MLQLQGSPVRLLAVKHPESADAGKLCGKESSGILGSATKGDSFLPPTLWNLDDAVDSVVLLLLGRGVSHRECSPRCLPCPSRCTQDSRRPNAGAQVLSSLLEKCLNIQFFSILSSEQIKSNTQVQFGIAHTRIPRTESAEGSVATGMNRVFEQTLLCLQEIDAHMDVRACEKKEILSDRGSCN